MNPTTQTCSICGAAFAAYRDRVHHEVDAHPVPDPVFDIRCQHGCGRTFQTMKAMVRHSPACPRNGESDDDIREDEE